ncbi:MAG: MoaD/ThiS family protein [Micrococcales bacterium]|nr:MoaD/ThiS family protein [Micrococcales bacterium]
MSLQVRYFAAAREAAGCPEEVWADENGTTVADLVVRLGARHGEPLTTVLARCSFLVDGQRAGPGAVVPGGAVVDVLPPFAGG